MDLSKIADLKRAIRDSLDRPSTRVLSNPGDGVAVVRPATGRCILHNAAFVEGIHFDLIYTTPAEVGHRCLATALNKLAALGARVRHASLGVGLRPEQGEIFVADLFEGASRLARANNLDLIAEHAFPSPSFLIVTVTILAEPIPASKLREEPSAREGDLVCVTGYPGSSACGLSLLRRMGRAEANRYPKARDAHLCPQPRLRAGETLARVGGVTGLVELRNGLARDLNYLSELTGKGLVVAQESLPAAPFFERTAQFLGADPQTWILYGGEDTELLFTIKPSRMPALQRAMAANRVPLRAIGEVVSRRMRVQLRGSDGSLVPLLPMVWSDYARRSRRVS